MSPLKAVPVVPEATDVAIPKSKFDDSQTKLDPFFPESKRRVDIVPDPHKTTDKPQVPTSSYYASVLVLNGMSGAANNRLVLINGKTLAQGEDANIDVGDNRMKDNSLHVVCQEIRKSSVILIVGEEKTPVELTLKQ